MTIVVRCCDVLASRGQSNGVACRRTTQSFESTLHRRRLRRSELHWMAISQARQDCEGGQASLCRQPAFDGGDMRIKHGWHLDPDLVRPALALMRGSRFAGQLCLAELLSKRRHIRRWCGCASHGGDLAGAAIDTCAKFGLRCSHLCQQCNRIERAIDIAKG